MNSVKYLTKDRAERLEAFAAMFEEVFTLSSRKAGAESKVALSDLPPASIKAIFAYGCQRFINDKLGGSEIGTDEATKKFWSIVDTLLSEEGYQGRAPAGAKTSADPIQAEMQKMAREAIKSALRAKGIPLKAVADRMDGFVQGYMEKNSEVLRKQAEVIVAAREGAAELDAMDLDLGF